MRLCRGCGGDPFTQRRVRSDGMIGTQTIAAVLHDLDRAVPDREWLAPSSGQILEL